MSTINQFGDIYNLTFKLNKIERQSNVYPSRPVKRAIRS